MLLSIGKACKKYNVCANTLRSYVHSGKLSEVRTPGGHFRLIEKELLALFNIKEG